MKEKSLILITGNTMEKILVPVVSSFSKSQLSGFKIVVAGRLTRKERAAFMVKKNGRVSLAKKSAIVDYSAQHKIMRFGLVGVKVWFMRKNIFYKPFLYKMSFAVLPLLTRNLLLPEKKKNLYNIQKRYFFKSCVGRCSKVLFKGPAMRQILDDRSMSTFAAAQRIAHSKITHPQITVIDGVHQYYYNDCSGYPHTAIVDLDSLKNNKIFVYGSFTTSHSPFNDVAPQLIDNKTFEGKNKNQYFHHFKNPLQIDIIHLKFSEKCHSMLKNNPKYKTLLVAIAERHKLSSDISVGEPIMIAGYKHVV